MRIGWATAICTPAKKLVSSGRAARPATMPATPAEANSVTPYCRTASKVISAKSDGDEHDHHLEDPLKNPHLGHVLARQEIVRDVEPEAAEIEIGCHTQRGHRDPAEQTNGHQAEQPGENVCRLAGASGVVGQGDGERDKQQAEPRRILWSRRGPTAQVRLPLAG